MRENIIWKIEKKFILFYYSEGFMSWHRSALIRSLLQGFILKTLKWTFWEVFWWCHYGCFMFFAEIFWFSILKTLIWALSALETSWMLPTGSGSCSGASAETSVIFLASCPVHFWNDNFWLFQFFLSLSNSMGCEKTKSENCKQQDRKASDKHGCFFQ